MSIAVVTGAGRGIGRAIAERLATDGHQLLLVDVSEAVEETARELEGTAVRADITAADGMAAIVSAVRESGHGPAVLVNNAGITRDAILRRMTEADFRAVLRVNLGGPLALTRELAPLLQDGGAVVNISSRAQLGNVGQFNYGVSKGGVIGVTRAMALALAPRLRVNAVAPGFVETEMTRAMPSEVAQRVVRQIPLAEPGQPMDIANAVAWLASHEARYVTGQVLYSCGGRSFA
ncbi:SDR family oxidoreductase [Nocardioides sp. AE5]|uniref:SDR family oxidoreductase n=1 Tax=Nocardioides sp. AE5 TaxID=2962573 RepID=UPI002882B430|nr:SDR family oxidoreductase [Nocardioides sp. AE5]MDT0203051.1 SDR family oxidoreductase [Nocardioides sp. AE5]